jgi:hypothetical protein
VSRWMMSSACSTMRTAMIFLPLLRPCIMRELVNLAAAAAGRAGENQGWGRGSASAWGAGGAAARSQAAPRPRAAARRIGTGQA